MSKTFLEVDDRHLRVDPYPLIKWLGSKSNYLDFLGKYLKKTDAYYEPFLGGASVFCYMFREGYISPETEVILSDINTRLINFYLQIKNNTEEFIELMNTFKEKNTRDWYYVYQKKVGDDELEDACIFLYLNKCSFRGLYQVNLKGEFNAAYGYRKKVNFVDEKKINNMSEALQNVSIINCDYKETLAKVRENSTLYLDPPYHNMYADYDKARFVEEDHLVLHGLTENLRRRNVYILQSNNYTPLIKELYGDWRIETIQSNLRFKHDKKSVECLILSE